MNMRSCNGSRYTLLVYIVSLHFLASHNLFVRSVATEFHVNGEPQSALLRSDDQSQPSIEPVNYSDGVIDPPPISVTRQNLKSLFKRLAENKKEVVAAIVIGALILTTVVLKKQKSLRLWRELTEASIHLKKELFEWECLFDKNLDYKTFLETREKMNRDLLSKWKHVHYNGNVPDDTTAFALQDPELEKQKQTLWQLKIEPYYLEADYKSFIRLRDLYRVIEDKIKRSGFDNKQLKEYNMYLFEPLSLDFGALRVFIDKRKQEGEAQHNIDEMEFFLNHSVEAINLCNKYATARRNYLSIFEDWHVKLLSLGKTLDDEEN